MNELFIAYLKAFRVSRKINIRQAAALCGVAASSWARWESGKSIPEAKIITRLEQLTGFEDISGDPVPTLAQLKYLESVLSTRPLQLHDKLDVSRSHCRQWLDGKCLPDRKHWAAIARMYTYYQNQEK